MTLPTSPRARAVGWLSQREHSRLELRRKLLRLPEVDAAEVETLLDDLAAKGYLSEDRFVESRLHVRAERLGGLRIRQELAQHGLKLSPEQAATLQATELDRARTVRERRFGPDLPQEAADRAKQARFLSGRGFSADIIGRVLRCSTDE